MAELLITELIAASAELKFFQRLHGHVHVYLCGVKISRARTPRRETKIGSGSLIINKFARHMTDMQWAVPFDIEINFANFPRLKRNKSVMRTRRR